jgi:predicted phage tail protein
MIDMRDGEYFYSVRAIDALGLEGLETRGRFRLKARPLPPAVQAPEPDAVLEPGRVAFSWAAVDEAAAYHFQLAADDAFTSPLVDRGGLTTREFAVDKLEAGTYYWRIASVRASGDQGPFGDPQILTLQAPAPAPASQTQ